MGKTGSHPGPPVTEGLYVFSVALTLGTSGVSDD